jgi:hypothetical protein
MGQDRRAPHRSSIWNASRQKPHMGGGIDVGKFQHKCPE